jgi:hypothetical protein
VEQTVVESGADGPGIKSALRDDEIVVAWNKGVNKYI